MVNSKHTSRQMVSTTWHPNLYPAQACILTGKLLVRCGKAWQYAAMGAGQPGVICMQGMHTHTQSDTHLYRECQHRQTESVWAKFRLTLLSPFTLCICYALAIAGTQQQQKSLQLWSGGRNLENIKGKNCSSWTESVKILNFTAVTLKKR